MAANALGILEGPNMTVQVGATAVAQFIRVIIAATTPTSGVPFVTVADHLSVGAGITKVPLAANTRGLIRLNNAVGTHIATAAGALAVGDTAFTKDAGKFGATETGAIAFGYVLTPTAADGDLFVLLPFA
jgi:hypothetical protein